MVSLMGRKRENRATCGRPVFSLLEWPAGLESGANHDADAGAVETDRDKRIVIPGVVAVLRIVVGLVVFARIRIFDPTQDSVGRRLIPGVAYIAAKGRCSISRTFSPVAIHEPASRMAVAVRTVIAAGIVSAAEVAVLIPTVAPSVVAVGIAAAAVVAVLIPVAAMSIVAVGTAAVATAAVVAVLISVVASSEVAMGTAAVATAAVVDVLIPVVASSVVAVAKAAISAKAAVLVVLMGAAAAPLIVGVAVAAALSAGVAGKTSVGMLRVMAASRISAIVLMAASLCGYGGYGGQKGQADNHFLH